MQSLFHNLSFSYWVTRNFNYHDRKKKIFFGEHIKFILSDGKPFLLKENSVAIKSYLSQISSIFGERK